MSDLGEALAAYYARLVFGLVVIAMLVGWAIVFLGTMVIPWVWGRL